MGKGVWTAVGGILGAGIGFLIAGPAGLYYGASIGMGLGSGADAYVLASQMQSQLQSLKDANGDAATTCQENLPVALAFGKVVVGGNIIRIKEAPSSEETAYNTMVVGHCQGEIDSFITTWINDIEWDDIKGKAHKLKYQHVGTWTQDPDEHGFVDLNMAYRGLAYSIIKFKQNDQIGVGCSVRVLIRGMKCVPIGGGAAVFTRNPVVILYHILTQIEGWETTDIDETSFLEAEAYCDEVPSGSEAPRYQFDFVFDSVNNINDAKKFIWGSFNGCCFMSQGKLKVAYAKIKDSSYDFDESNIVEGSLTYQVAKKYNIVKLTFLDSTDDYTSATVEERDDDDIIENGESILALNCEYITNEEVAKRRVKYIFNQIRYNGITAKLTAFPESMQVEPFDVIQISYALFGWTDKKFMVKSKDESQEGYCTFELDEYSPDLYTDALSVRQTSLADAKRSQFRAIADPTEVVVVENSYKNVDGLIVPSVKVTYEPPQDNIYNHSDIYVKSNRNTTYVFIGSDYSYGTGYTIDSGKAGFAVGDTITVAVVAVSTMGVTSSEATEELATATLKLDSLIVNPDPPTGLKLVGAANANSYAWSGNSFEMTWLPASQTGGFGREGFGQEISGMGGVGVDPYWLYDEVEIWTTYNGITAKRFSTKTRDCSWKYILGDTQDVELDAFILASNGIVGFHVRRWNTFNKRSPTVAVALTHASPASSYSMNPTTNFLGKDCRINWDPYTKLDFKDYSVKVYSDSGRTTLVRTEKTTSPSYTYSWEKNVADNGGTGLSTVYFSVQVNTQYGLTKEENVSASNSTPSTPSAPTVTGAFQRIKIDWTAVSDVGIIGYNVYVGTGANPTTLVGFVNGTSFMYEAVAGTTYYARIKAVNSFGAGDYSADGSGAASHLDPAEAAGANFEVPLPNGIAWSTLGSSIGWSTGVIYYKGTSYTITAGSAANKFIYWDEDDTPTTFHGTDTLPVVGADVWVLAIYIAATNSMFTMVGNKKMHGSILADDSIAVDQMGANSVDSDQYVDGSIDHVHLADDTVETHNIKDLNVTDAKIASVSASKVIGLQIPDVVLPKGVQETQSTDYTGTKTFSGGETGLSLVYCGNNKLFCSGTDYGYISDDGGDTWVASSSGGADLDHVVYCGNGKLVGVLNTGAVYLSSDYGDTWAAASGGSLGTATRTSVEYCGNGIVLFGIDGTSKGIYKSTDYGDTWTQPYNTTDINTIKYLGDGIAIANHGTTGDLYRSDDYGATWTLVYDDPGGVMTGTINPMVEVRDGIVLVARTSSGTPDILKSIDNGLNWTTALASIGHAPTCFCNLGSNIILLGTGEHLHKTVNDGASLSDLGASVLDAAIDIVFLGNGIIVSLQSTAISKSTV